MSRRYHYQYREEPHNSQLPAERIIYAKLEALCDYVTARGNKKVEGQPFICSSLVSSYPGSTIRMHQKKLHSDTLVYYQIVTNICATWSLQALKPSFCRVLIIISQKCRFYTKESCFLAIRARVFFESVQQSVLLKSVIAESIKADLGQAV